MSSKLGDYIEAYIKLRDKKAAMDEDHKKALAPIENAIAQLEGFFLKHLESLGLETLKGGAGTVYTSRVYAVKTADKSAFFDFVKDHDAWHLADIRPAKTAIGEYLEAQGVPPPGVDVTAVLNVNVRRS